MKLLFEAIKDEFLYSVEVESIIYNRDNMDESLIEVAAENLAQSIIDRVFENEKFIKDKLEIDTFDMEFLEFDNPTLMLSFTTNKLVEEDDLSSAIGRYTNQPYKEEIDGSTIEFKPVRNELKIQFHR